MGLSEVHRKLKIASDLFDLAVKVKSTQVKAQNPDWSDEQVRARVMELIERGCR
jgi:hypothetical protein